MGAGATALLLAIGGGAAGIATFTRDDPKPRTVTAVGGAASTPTTAGNTPPAADPTTVVPAYVPPIPSDVGELSDGGGAGGANDPVPAGAIRSRTGIRAGIKQGSKAGSTAAKPAGKPGGEAAGNPVPKAAPLITTRTEVETREIPYATSTVRDPSLPRGIRQVVTPGVAGEETLRYLVTLTNGRPTGRKLLDSTVTRAPQQEVVAVGDQPIQPAPQYPPPPRPHCGVTLDFCGPLGRDPYCRHHPQESAGVSVTGNDVTLLSDGYEPKSRC
jgi:hypothetical protein